MLSSNEISHAFDLATEANEMEVLAKSQYFAEAKEKESGIDTFGCLGCAGTMGGCFGCLGTAGCCC